MQAETVSSPLPTEADIMAGLSLAHRLHHASVSACQRRLTDHQNPDHTYSYWSRVLDELERRGDVVPLRRSKTRARNP